jgi:N-acetylmuramoyl-L-alanine amidase
VVEHKTEKGTMFKVQLYALRGKFREYSRAAQLFSEISSEEIGNGITRYYGGKAKSYAEAKKILETAVGNGYSDAFIVGFKDGSRLTPQELKGYEK